MDFSYFINNILKFMKTNLIRFHNYKFNDCFRCFTHVLLSWDIGLLIRFYVLKIMIFILKIILL